MPIADSVPCSGVNVVRPFNLDQFETNNFCSHSIVNAANFYSDNVDFTKPNEVYWLLKAISLIDLTTLAGDDTWVNVDRLGLRSLNPISQSVLLNLKAKFDINADTITTAAVCVYPNMVENLQRLFEKTGRSVPIAAVATGFPSGQYPLHTRLEEINFAIDKGATEIDIVINRSLVLNGDWEEMYNEVVKMRKACGPKVHLKTILAVGELETYKNIYIASVICMLAGADFIKTSTGKETTINATLAVTYIMCCAIHDFDKMYNFRVGYKPAGGLRTYTDALKYLMLVKRVLGNDWINPSYLRFGASSLLNNLDSRLFQLTHEGRVPLPGELSVF